MAHFMACTKTNDAIQVVELYFREVKRLLGVPRAIVFDRYAKFPSHFYLTLWKMFGTNIKFSTTCHP